MALRFKKKQYRSSGMKRLGFRRKFGTGRIARNYGKMARKGKITQARSRGRGVKNSGYQGSRTAIKTSLFKSKAKKAYDLKKYGGFVPNNRRFYDALFADNTLNMSYVDRAETSEATASAAKQAIWGSRVTTDGRNGSTMIPMFNLCVHDPRILGQIDASTTGPPNWSYQKTAKVLIKNYRCRAALTNIETGPIEVWEYRLIARQRMAISTWNVILATIRDSTVGPSTATNVISGTGFDLPTASTTAAGSSTTQINVGVNPYQMAALTKWCKISSVKKKCMQPNDRWEIEYTCNKPMVYDNEKWNLASSPSSDGSVVDSGLQPGQGFSVFVMKGTYAANTGGAAGQLIGLGNAAVGIEYYHDCHYALIQNNFSSHQIIQDVAGFTRGEDGYWAPTVLNTNLNAISTGPVPGTAGTEVQGPAGSGVADDEMKDN